MTRPPLAAATAGAALLATALAGCSSTAAPAGASAGPPKLRVVEAYVPQPPLADMAAGYFTVLNTGGTEDRLTAVSSSAASAVSLMVTRANGSMAAVHELPIPAGGELQLRVGGDHLMLMGLKGRPVAGQHVTFVLHFARSGAMTVRVPVEPAAYQPKG